jgi:hypothetical protein
MESKQSANSCTIDQKQDACYCYRPYKELKRAEAARISLANLFDESETAFQGLAIVT